MAQLRLQHCRSLRSGVIEARGLHLSKKNFAAFLSFTAIGGNTEHQSKLVSALHCMTKTKFEKAPSERSELFEDSL
eukprot:5091674-Amphidinium_carterae.1